MVILAIGDRTVYTSCVAAEIIIEHALSTSGMLRAASDSIVKGVESEGKSIFFDSSVASIVSIDPWIILARAFSSAKALLGPCLEHTAKYDTHDN